MSRNPHATNLRHHKPKRIEDKRDKLLGKFYADPDEWDDCDIIGDRTADDIIAEMEADGATILNRVLLTQLIEVARETEREARDECSRPK